jgi:RNA polymerase sigma factor (sigma-70 family)
MKGDESAEEKLFKYLLARFRLLARQRVGKSDAIEEIAQETCITVFEKYKTENFKASFEAWAHGVFRMMIRRYYERLQIEWKRFANDKSEEREVFKPVDPELEREIGKCLKKIAKINRNYARAINLLYQGYKTDEVCQKLRIERKNLYVIVSRGRSMLKACLKLGKG